MLATSERVTSAVEGEMLLASNEGAEAFADQVQKVVALGVPLLRIVATGARFARVPWVLVGSTAVSVTVTVWAGVQEVRVLGSLVAHRIQEATGAPPDPALVRKLTIDLYLAPKRQPDISSRRLGVGRLVRRWVFRGATGRRTAKFAKQALEAAEQLDVGPLIARWEKLPVPSTPPASPDRSGDDR
jgi:hypothetical protein